MWDRRQKYHFVSEDFWCACRKKIGTTATQKLHNKLREMMEDKGAFVFPLCEMKSCPYGWHRNFWMNYLR